MLANSSYLVLLAVLQLSDIILVSHSYYANVNNLESKGKPVIKKLYLILQTITFLHVVIIDSKSIILELLLLDKYRHTILTFL